MYTKVLEEKSEEFKSELDKSEDELKPFSSLFERKIHRFQNKEFSEDFIVVCADAGRNSTEFKHKSTLIVARAAAVDSEGNTSRSMLADIVTKHSQSSFEDLRDRAGESLEIEAIKELLKKHKKTDKQIFILIDGSLLTRSLVLPSELNLSKHQDYKLNLIDNLFDLYSIVRENSNMTLLGISKDSNTDLFYTSILVEELRKELSDNEVENVQNLIDKVRRFRNQPLEMEKIKENIRNEVYRSERALSLIELLENPRYDTALMDEFSSEGSYTSLIESGLISQKLKSRLEHFSNDKDSYVERYFSKTISSNLRDKGRIIESIEKIESMPTITTSYWKPEKNAQPLRIDIPSFEFNEDYNTLADLEGSRVLGVNDKLSDILDLLYKGYGGETMHNVWISEADSIAGLSNRELENVFLPLMSQKLEINLRDYLRRRDKRV